MSHFLILRFNPWGFLNGGPEGARDAIKRQMCSLRKNSIAASLHISFPTNMKMKGIVNMHRCEISYYLELGKNVHSFNE